MKAPLEHIHISLQGKEHLLKLKKATGIEHWNVLCRWAFCTSLADGNKLDIKKLPANSSIEIGWKTFSGNYSVAILSSLIIFCKKAKITPNMYGDALRCHIHRGLYLLASNNDRINYAP